MLKLVIEGSFPLIANTRSLAFIPTSQCLTIYDSYASARSEFASWFCEKWNLIKSVAASEFLSFIWYNLIGQNREDEHKSLACDGDCSVEREVKLHISACLGDVDENYSLASALRRVLLPPCHS